MVRTGPMPKAIGGRIPHLDAGGVDAPAAAPGRPIRRARQGRSSRPAAQASIGFLPARRRGDGAVLERRAEAIADAVERGDHVGRELPASASTASTSSIVRSPRRPSSSAGSSEAAVFERKTHVGERSVIGHGRSPLGYARKMRAGSSRAHTYIMSLYGVPRPWVACIARPPRVGHHDCGCWVVGRSVCAAAA